MATPPYLGYNRQSDQQKNDLKEIFESLTNNWRSLDYITGWIGKFLVCAKRGYDAAFVTTNSLCQGEHASILWPIVYDSGLSIHFAVPDFRWSNNAANNAGVTVSVVGLTARQLTSAKLYNLDHVRSVASINQYLMEGDPIKITASSRPVSAVPPMLLGNMPKDGGNLILSMDEVRELTAEYPAAKPFIHGFVGSQEIINGGSRHCLWISDDRVQEAIAVPPIASRLDAVAAMRNASPAKSTQAFASKPHRFKQIQGVAQRYVVAVPSVSSERRRFLPVDLLPKNYIVSSLAFCLYDAPLWTFSLVASRLHLVWVATVCGKLETRYRYSNTMGWNAFPVPRLTEQNKTELIYCAENILLARQAHFPATIAELYEPDSMPEDLRRAHEANDEALERVYIGRRFRNDTERMEKLFELYTRLTSQKAA